jgi:hypothetical protein
MIENKSKSKISTKNPRAPTSTGKESKPGEIDLLCIVQDGSLLDVVFPLWKINL